MPYNNIYTTGGTIRTDGAIYIKRTADDELIDLCQRLEFVFVLSARQSGKSSLMVQTAEHLKDYTIQSIIIDFSALGVRATPDQWYLGILHEIKSSANLQIDIVQWWKKYEMLGQSQRLVEFFREVLLQEVDSNVVIFFDEIDSTISVPFSDDFFAALRAVYNARAMTPEFRRLGFVLIGVATPSDLMKNNARTPINIGKRVELTDFTLTEALPLAVGLGENSTDALSWILEWTGGHPYLTQKLCDHLAKSKEQLNKDSVKLAVMHLFDGDQGQQDHNLQFVRDMLTRRAPNSALVLETYARICKGVITPDDENSIVKAHLKISGIVRRMNGNLVLRNKIYKMVFDENWTRGHRPDDNDDLKPVTQKSSFPRFPRLPLWPTVITIALIPTILLLYQLVHTEFIQNFLRYVQEIFVELIKAEISINILILTLLITVLLVLAINYIRNKEKRNYVGQANTNEVVRLTARVRRQEPKARLIALQGLPRTERLEFDLFGETPIGRSKEYAQLIFDNDNLSRLHCIIHESHAGYWTIEDQESANGTFVNGFKLQPFVEKEIDQGSIIELGPVEYGGIKFRFEIIDVFSGNADWLSDDESLNRINESQKDDVRTTQVIKSRTEDTDFDPSDPANQKW